MAISPLKLAIGIGTGGVSGAAMGAVSSSNTPLGRMASMYGNAKALSNTLGSSSEQGKMQGVQGNLQDNFKKAIDPKTAIADAVAALDHPDADPAHVAYAAPEILAAHHFGDKGNDALTHWYSLQDVEG